MSENTSEINLPSEKSWLQDDPQDKEDFLQDEKEFLQDKEYEDVPVIDTDS